MGHERHMVLLVGFFDWNNHLDQIWNHTSNQEGQISKMVHQDAHGQVKLAILIWSSSLLIMPTKLFTYILA
jgi:hypothetical protein